MPSVATWLRVPSPLTRTPPSNSPRVEEEYVELDVVNVHIESDVGRRATIVRGLAQFANSVAAVNAAAAASFAKTAANVAESIPVAKESKQPDVKRMASL